MGIDGRQWNTMAFHGLTKPFQGAGIRDFSTFRKGRKDGLPFTGHSTPRFRRFCGREMLVFGRFRAVPERFRDGGARKAKKPEKKKSQTACKPGSVPAGAGDGHSSGTPVTGRLARPTRAAARKPACRTSIAWEPACRLYLVLLPVGFALPPPLPGARCALTAPFHPCRGPEPVRRFAFCGTFPGVAPAGR